MEQLATTHVDQLISLADGHIVLSAALLKGGVAPPLDPTASLTRIGVGTANKRGIASSAAMRKVARRLRLELAVMQDLWCVCQAGHPFASTIGPPSSFSFVFLLFRWPRMFGGLESLTADVASAS